MSYLFLSYAREDYDAVAEVYTALHKAGVRPWMDKPPAPWQDEGIPVGALWESYIRSQIEHAERVLLFLSTVSVAKTGYVQKEIRYALSGLALRPPEQRFLLPIRLDGCEIPDVEVETIRLRAYHWFDLFDRGIEALVKGIAGRKPEQILVDRGVFQAVFEDEASRSSTKDRKIAELEEELAFARSQIPPAEIWDDENYKEWWLRNR